MSEVQHVLDGYKTVEQFGKAIKRCERTVRRMIQRREIAFTFLGPTLLIDVQATRDLMRARAIKSVAKAKRAKRR